jgi:hypothetical protein
MASNDMIAPNPSKMELLWAKRKEANSVPESRAALHGALKRPEAAGDNHEARPKLQKPDTKFG